MRRALIALLLLCAIGDARAERERAVVAVLPMTTDDARLALYTNAVATALARELDGLPGARVEAVTPREPVPTRVDLVVGGHLSQTEAGVSIQFTVRDPELGAPVATLPTRAVPLARIDRLVTDTGATLRDVLARELEAQGRRRAARTAPIQLPVTVVEGERVAARAPTGIDGAPAIAVLLATHTGDFGALPVNDIATAAAFDLVRRLGYEPVAAKASDIGSFSEAGKLARKAGAVATLKLHVRDLAFEQRGVMTARGRLRVMMISPEGERMFDAVVRTDTVVGSRGDRVDAIVRFVAGQAMDVCFPMIRKALAQ